MLTEAIFHALDGEEVVLKLLSMHLSLMLLVLPHVHVQHCWLSQSCLGSLESFEHAIHPNQEFWAIEFSWQFRKKGCHNPGRRCKESLIEINHRLLIVAGCLKAVMASTLLVKAVAPFVWYGGQENQWRSSQIDTWPCWWQGHVPEVAQTTGLSGVCMVLHQGWRLTCHRYKQKLSQDSDRLYS